MFEFLEPTDPEHSSVCTDRIATALLNDTRNTLVGVQLLEALRCTTEHQQDVVYRIWKSKGRTTTDIECIHVTFMSYARHALDVCEGTPDMYEYDEYPFVISHYPRNWAQGGLPTVVAMRVCYWLQRVCPAMWSKLESTGELSSIRGSTTSREISSMSVSHYKEAYADRLIT